MTIAQVRSRARLGLAAPDVMVEVHLANGLPAFQIVGLPQAEVRESRDRVRAALLESGFEFPNRRITVNLAPADLPKASGRFDLPIALGILGASGQLPPASLEAVEAVGELSLNGRLKPVQGLLALALHVRELGQQRVLLIPQANAGEAARIEGLKYVGLADLREARPALAELAERTELGASPEPGEDSEAAFRGLPDLADIRGQPQARRALEIAAAGGHNLLLQGPPGAGKSMLAQRLPGLLPPLSDTDALETAAVASVAGHLDAKRYRLPPFRSPHHSASGIALVGGGVPARPGEISLANHGVLFLDELPEFGRDVLEMLREPLETGRIGLSRSARQVEYPARFQLVAAMNPCPCGYLGHPMQACVCTGAQIARYRHRVSGPLLDRIDLQVFVAPVSADELTAEADGESSPTVRRRVLAARRHQHARQGKTNVRLEVGELDAHCRLDAASQALLRSAISRLRLSARACHRVLKVARTVADLAGTTDIALLHLAEALELRRGLHDIDADAHTSPEVALPQAG